MNSSTKNKIVGKVHEVKGKIKQKVGNATRNNRLEAQGIGENFRGKVQTKVGQVQKMIEKP